MREIVVAVLMVIGGVFCCIAGLGILRLPDVIMRMHASTKASTLGAGLILAAVAIHFARMEVVTPALATIAFFVFDRSGVGAPVGQRGVPNPCEALGRHVARRAEEICG